MIPRMTTIGVLNNYRYDLNKSNNNMTRAMNTVMTRRNFNSYAEDPALATRCFQIRRSFLRTASQLDVNTSLVSKYDQAWSALDTVSQDIYDSTVTQNSTAFGSVLRAENGPDASGRNALGQALSALAQSLVQTMNGRSGENYIFGGADTLNAPFTWGAKLNPAYLAEGETPDPTNPDHASMFEYIADPAKVMTEEEFEKSGGVVDPGRLAPGTLFTDDPDLALRTSAKENELANIADIIESLKTKIEDGLKALKEEEEGAKDFRVSIKGSENEKDPDTFYSDLKGFLESEGATGKYLTDKSELKTKEVTVTYTYDRDINDLTDPDGEWRNWFETVEDPTDPTKRIPKRDENDNLIPKDDSLTYSEDTHTWTKKVTFSVSYYTNTTDTETDANTVVENPAYDPDLRNYKYVTADGKGTNDETEAEQALYFRGVPVDSNNYEKNMEYFLAETKYLDVGLGHKEWDSEALSSTVFNSALQGIYYLGGYGYDEETITLSSGEITSMKLPNNLISIINELGTILQRCDPDNGDYANEEDAMRAEALAHKLEDQQKIFVQRYAEIDTRSSFLRDNGELLTDTADSLAQQFLGLEEVDPADAITAYMYARYCYDAALKLGNSVLPQSLMDYMSL